MSSVSLRRGKSSSVVKTLSGVVICSSRLTRRSTTYRGALCWYSFFAFFDQPILTSWSSMRANFGYTAAVRLRGALALFRRRVDFFLGLGALGEARSASAPSS